MMKNLKDILAADASAPGVILRAAPYAEANARGFLEDVLALANAETEGPRYIVIGAEDDASGIRQYHPVAEEDLDRQFGLATLVGDYVEPPVTLRNTKARIDGKLLGVFEILDCIDKPYLMRNDFSETLRRGDGWVRVGANNVKLGRRQLQEIFERRLQNSVAVENIEVGFAGEYLLKEIDVTTTDFSKLPSAIETAKLRQLLTVQDASKNMGSTTIMARLTHARLFGADNPYEERSAEQLRQEIVDAVRKHKNADDYFLFEEHSTELQLVAINHGSELIQEASLALVLPNHRGCRIAEALPMRFDGNGLEPRSEAEQAEYPRVSNKPEAIHVSYSVGDLPPDTPRKVFRIPLRICVDNRLKDRRMGIQFSLFGRNLRAPVKGKLRLQFREPLL